MFKQVRQSCKNKNQKKEKKRKNLKHLFTQVKSWGITASSHQPIFHIFQMFEHFAPAKYPTWGNEKSYSQIPTLLPLLKLPFQLAKSSIIPFSMTQLTPNRENTMVQSFLATVQWRSRWSMVFPSLIHVQHLSFTTNLHFQRLSVIRFFPRVAV